MRSSISLLLGAGFSAPMGYPIGNQLNSILLNCTGEEFAFHTNGSLVTSTDGKKPNFGYKTSYDIRFDFCMKMIKYFNESRRYFDYEEFYDFIKDEAQEDKQVELLAQSFVVDEKVDQLIYSLENIYTQLISYYLKDSEGNAFYDNSGYMIGSFFPKYTGILNYLNKISGKYLLNIHTLNHDLFFELLNNTEWLKGELCDGFEELGSPYYGKLEANGRVYHARLERYTGIYRKNLRLYKLHGSRDYVVYYTFKGNIGKPEKYLKTRFGIGFSDLYKEKENENNELEYESCPNNYHADFLTGTTSKIERYKEPLLYKDLFELFKQNLKEAKSLLIIGYGGKDKEINKMIFENFDFKNKKSFIIDPFPGEKVKELAATLNSTIIEKQLQEIDLNDLKM
jgi:hypothetical protein